MGLFVCVCVSVCVRVLTLTKNGFGKLCMSSVTCILCYSGTDVGCLVC